MTDLPPELQQLEAQMANIQLFVTVMHATDKFRSPETAEGAAVLAERLRYVFDLEDQNLLMAAGPLDRGQAEMIRRACNCCDDTPTPVAVITRSARFNSHLLSRR